eukprot:Blabericola_migrator_1__2501@NODE_1702_length_3972_cov_8_630474_g1102_i0_p3_GENE_NODE_1702_length_3972_cov_8_630474_g1102_i0NODE_1702_length_3972_cov_8_630474_g1102_i0_p3_ORF_typecomplete_len167_score10_05RVP/PF00077_20/0_00064gagasp_proteas/PF13975_6/0_036Asp_protease_2/PF13650_6/0_12_NODE_1702_length_3972_cov_8_630474_g1102_i021442644
MEETPQSPTPSTEAGTPAPTLTLNRVTSNIPPKDEVLVRVDGITISAQIDGGADCSVLAKHLLPTLPSHIKSAWESREEQEEVCLATGTTNSRDPFICLSNVHLGTSSSGSLSYMDATQHSLDVHGSPPLKPSSITTLGYPERSWRIIFTHSGYRYSRNRNGRGKV